MFIGRSQFGFTRIATVAICALTFALVSQPVAAQKSGGSTGGSTGGGSRGTPGAGAGGSTSRPFPPPLQPGLQPGMEPGEMPTPEIQPMVKPMVPEGDEACLPWEMPRGQKTSISAAQLAVPGKARGQYQKACGAFKKNNLTEAEQHSRDAIEKYPNYSAAWVMLGQSLLGQQKVSDAQDACAQPIKTDPTYLPPYLCLAGILSRQKKWEDLAMLSDRFAGLNLAGDLYANYYRGLAQFHLRKLPEAQKSVQAAIALDTEHHQNGLNFLLAQIYGEQGDLPGASAQIDTFIKYAKSKQDQDDAREYLAELQTRLSAK